MVSKKQGLYYSQETRIPVAVIGLDAAGKTSFVRRLKGEEFLERSLPTAGLDTNFIEINGLFFQLFDLGGHRDFRNYMWENYIKLSKGIIFIIDSNDIEKADEAKKWFWKALKWNKKATLLILLNKTDLPVFIGRQELIELINLKELPLLEPSRSFQIFEVSMKTGKNLDKALAWFTEKVAEEVSESGVKIFGVFFYLSNGLPITAIKIDPNLDTSLFTGYLNALDSFTSDSLGLKEGLQSIYTMNHRIMIVKRKDIICAVVSDTESEAVVSRIIAESLLGFMEDHFSKKIKEFTRTGKISITKRGITYFLERNFPGCLPDNFNELD